MINFITFLITPVWALGWISSLLWQVFKGGWDSAK